MDNTDKSYCYVNFAVRSRYAMFSDILTRAGGEKLTYPIPTYEALKGVCHSIYWKPTFMWIVDDVRIMNPIRIHRKGIKTLKYGGGHDLSYYAYLEDVYYQVRAHFEWNPNRPELEKDRILEKHSSIARRMIDCGGRRDIFLGTRDCQAYAEPCYFGSGSGAYDHCGTIPYGLMEHGITYADEAVRNCDKGKMTLRLWQPVMKNGCIHFIRPEQCGITRHVKNMDIKAFGRDKNFAGLSEFAGGEADELVE